MDRSPSLPSSAPPAVTPAESTVVAATPTVVAAVPSFQRRVQFCTPLADVCYVHTEYGPQADWNERDFRAYRVGLRQAKLRREAEQSAKRTKRTRMLEGD